MAGNPNRRHRSTLQTNLPMPVYAGLSERQRIERLSGWSLDRVEEILYPTLVQVLAQPQAPMLLNAQLQCIRAVWNVMLKSGFETKRLEVEREKILADLTKREFGSPDKDED